NTGRMLSRQNATGVDVGNMASGSSISVSNTLIGLSGNNVTGNITLSLLDALPIYLNGTVTATGPNSIDNFSVNNMNSGSMLSSQNATDVDVGNMASGSSISVSNTLNGLSGNNVSGNITSGTVSGQVNNLNGTVTAT